ncbi:MAG TPA: HAMP domain-containing sensor histidine kinase [Planosporangium sp.]|nr:HAMP domain-containing sensor histidine kinase [Planosporangium sp.]
MAVSTSRADRRGAEPPVGGPTRWRRWVAPRLGVRLRSALAAVIVVALVLGVAAVAFVVLHRRSLTAIADTAATAGAQAVAERVRVGDQAGVDRLLRPRVGEDTVVQVLRADGTVVAASPEVIGEAALSPLRPAPGATLRHDRRLPVAQEDLFRIVAVGVSSPSGHMIVLAGQSLRPVSDAVAAEILLLAVGYPFLLALVGAATGSFAGRSLRPVEELRTRVASISARQLHERVPVPVARDEIYRLAQTMNAMLDRLERSATAQRRFVADASHELRSPLATLQVGLELLHTGLRSGDHHDEPASVEILQEEAERLARIVDDLLLLARVDEHGLTPRREDVDLDDIVDAEVRRVRATPGPSVSARMQPVQVSGDRNQLSRALRNLIDNATRHTRTAVELRLWADNGWAHLEIADDGPGIPVAEREHVFERFVRLEDGRQRATGGTGLGLAIVFEIITGHGGTVTVADTHGGGATFHVALPQNQPSA